MKYKLVIFDVDGTLVSLRKGSCGPFSFELLPGVREECAALREAGVTLAIASNQSPQRHEMAIVRQMYWTAGALGINPRFGLVAWSTDDATRKPDPYMLEACMSIAFTTPQHTLFVGDQETDRQAAEAAGCDFMWANEFFFKWLGAHDE